MTRNRAITHLAGCKSLRWYCDDPQCSDSTWDHRCAIPYPCDCGAATAVDAAKRRIQISSKPTDKVAGWELTQDGRNPRPLARAEISAWFKALGDAGKIQNVLALIGRNKAVVDTNGVWVIDQVFRILAGNDYERIMARMESITPNTLVVDW